MDSSPTPAPRTKPTWPSYPEIGADFIGEVIDGRYRIVERLAKGGMAHVFLAKDMTRRCHVALKILHRTGSESRRRFEVEVEVLSNIQHPHIVRPVAFGHTPDGQPYMALEHLRGETLSQRLARGPLPWREVAEFGAQIAGALHALHNAGVIHRDVKPDNIMIAIGADRAVAKLIDLGLASVGTPFHEAQDARFASQVPERHKTQLGHQIGTPAYLPPEAGQCAADPRLDVYSLGMTLYQLCARVLPDPTDVRPFQEVCPDSDAPADLFRLLRAALEPDAAERLSSADRLRRGLEAILAAHPRSERPLFGGCYDRLEMIGVGASAVVFRASDRELSREVALKVLRDAKPSEDDTIRFRRAAKILSALRHPNIPQIHHFGVDRSEPEKEQRFAVTELCRGSTATNYARPGQHLRPDEVLAVGRQLASALAAVHAIGVIYRDLHTGNVLISRGESPQAWLFDFDQALVSPQFYARLTERWATPPEERLEPVNEKPLRGMDYTAPEVRAGGAFTAASDVFGLGMLLYRLLTGRRPFPPKGETPTPARKVCRACPPALENLLMSMLSPDPRKRPDLAMVEKTLADEEEVLEEEREAEREEEAAPPRVAQAAEAQASAPPDAARETTATEAGVAPAEVATTTVAAAGVEASPALADERVSRIWMLLAAGLAAALGLVLAAWWFQERPTATQAAPAAGVAVSEDRANSVDTELAREDVRNDMSSETSKSDSPGMPAEARPAPEPAAEGPKEPAPPRDSPAQPRKKMRASQGASWETRIAQAEAHARRCLEEKGEAMKPRRVTLAADEPPIVRGVASNSPTAECIRAAVKRFHLLVAEGERQHTFFAAP